MVQAPPFFMIPKPRLKRVGSEGVMCLALLVGCLVGAQNVYAQSVATPRATTGGANPAVFVADVGGRTPQFCSISAPSLSQTTNPINVRALSGATLEIENFINTTTLASQAASVAVAFDAVCNYPHSLSLGSANNGLWRQSTAPAIAPFANAVPYRALASWGDQVVDLNADSGSRRAVTSSVLAQSPRIGQVTLSLQIDPGATNVATNSPLLQGTYSDLITVTLGPQS
jgi:hypothetical protein